MMARVVKLTASRWLAPVLCLGACSDATVGVPAVGGDSGVAEASTGAPGSGPSDDDIGGSGMVLDTDATTTSDTTSSADTTSDTSTTGPALDGTTSDDPTTTGPTPTFCEITDCDDDDPCTVDACDPDAETCTHDLTPGTPCDDANECTSEDVCQPDGTCSGEGLCTVEHCGEIAEDETWGPEEIHLLTCPVYVRGPASPTLTILDGARVEFGPAAHAMIVGQFEPGRLDVQGDELGVVFTSAEASPLPGDWDTLAFHGYDAGSTLTGAIIEYAGAFDTTAIYTSSGCIEPTEVHISNSIIRDNAGHGIWVSDCAGAAIEGTSILDNGGDGVLIGDWAHLNSPFVNNIVTGNSGAAVRLPANEVAGLDPSSSYAGNGEPVVAAGYIGESVTWQLLDVDYHVPGAHIEWGGVVTTLTIEPGVTIVTTFDFMVGDGNDAALHAVGTQDAPIRFIGGHLRFNAPTASSLLEHVIVEGGEGVEVFGPGSGVVTISNSVIRSTTGPSALHVDGPGASTPVILTDTVIEDNEGIGVDAERPMALVSGNTIMNNGGGRDARRARGPGRDGSVERDRRQRRRRRGAVPPGPVRVCDVAGTRGSLSDHR